MSEPRTPRDNPEQDPKDASRLIDELQEVSGRGASTGNGTS